MKIEWAVREDGEDHVVINRTVGDDGEPRVWKDVARLTGKYSRSPAEDIARVMNKHEAQRNQ